MKSLARRLGTALFLLIFAVFVVGPLVWLALRAFSGTWQYPHLLPDSWTLKWWTQVLDSADLGGSIRLSLVFAPVVTLVSAVICLPAAYPSPATSSPAADSCSWPCSRRTPSPRSACSCRWQGSSTRCA